MSKSDLIELTGAVEEVLPGNMFRVKVDNLPNILTCYTSGKLKQHKISARPPAMPKEDAIHVPAQVLSPLGVAAYRMRLANGYELVAHVTRKLQPVIGAIQPGDTVELELSPFDLSRGRIIGRCGTP